MGKPPNSSTRQDLHTAARTGDLNSVKSILSSNPLAINSRDKHSRTPNLGNRLHLAAWAGQSEVVSYLCKQKADVGAAAMDDMGAIHFAAQKGHMEIVRTLLLSGVSVKSTTRKGFTPLHYASQGSHIELVKYLVKKGVSISLKTKAGKTPTDLAGNEEVRSFLEECEGSSNKGEPAKEEAKESNTNTSTTETLENQGAESHDAAVKEGDERGKRKGGEDGLSETLSEPKKPKVALNHLFSEDDTTEDEGS